MPMQANAEMAREKARQCLNNPKLLITYLWFATIFFGVLYGFAAIVAAIVNNGEKLSDSKSLGFAGILDMFLVIGLSVGGTLVMRKYQTPLAVGFFIGVVIMMAIQMFELCILFSGMAASAREEKRRGEKGTNVYSNDFAAIFSFFMAVLYAAFAAVLIKHRYVVIKEGVSLDPNALPDKMPQSNMPPVNLQQQMGGASPRLARPDIEQGKQPALAPPVSV